MELTGPHWPAGAYARTALPERVLMFGTGMLLRAIVAAAVDDANRRGAFNGRLVLVQSTDGGNAAAVNAQDGLFTLVEQGLDGGRAVRRTRLVGSISRALRADRDWPAVRDAATRPELRVIVSNVTEAGFRLDAPTRFPARLTELLHARFTCLPDGPPLVVIPTELVEDNGTRLAAMVDELAGSVECSREFRRWLGAHVRFCSSLVDRITTRAPRAAAAELEPAFEAVGRHSVGDMSDEDLDELEQVACPSAGACGAQFTANTMATVSEAIGLALPYSAGAPAPYEIRDAFCMTAGEKVVDLIRESIRPRDIVTRKALENAAAVVAASGGSTNAALHLPAIAHECGIKFDLFDVARIFKKTPYIADLILKKRIDEVKEAMNQSSDRGMLTFDNCLFTLYKEDKIELEEALTNADSRTNLEAKINFGG